jgi:hypothetical protein
MTTLLMVHWQWSDSPVHSYSTRWIARCQHFLDNTPFLCNGGLSYEFVLESTAISQDKGLDDVTTFYFAIRYCPSMFCLQLLLSLSLETTKRERQWGFAEHINRN